MAEETWFEKYNPIKAMIGGEVVETSLSVDGEPGGGAIAETIKGVAEKVDEASRMIALRRSLTIGAVLLAISALLKGFKVKYWSGVMATVGVVTIVLAVAQYAI